MSESELKFRQQEHTAAKIYDHTYEKDSIEGWNNAVPDFVRQYKEELQADSDKRVLDLGCGQGRNTIFLAQNSFDTYGIDVSGQGLKQAQVQLDQLSLGAHLQKGTMFALPYESKFFKAVFSNASLQSLGGSEASGRAFAESSRVLKEGGLFFVYVNAQPAVEAIRSLPGAALGLHYYSEEFIRDLAKRNGFEIENMATEVVRDPKTETDIAMWKVVF